MIYFNNNHYKTIKKKYEQIVETEETEEKKSNKDNKNNDIDEIEIDKKTLEKIIGKGSGKKTLEDYADDLFTRVRTIVKKAEYELEEMSFLKSQLPDKELKNALRELADKITKISIKLKNYKEKDDNDNNEEKENEEKEFKFPKEFPEENEENEVEENKEIKIRNNNKE